MFHYATYRNDEIIILGYNITKQDCIVVKLAGLPGSDQEELRRITSSNIAQNEPYLVKILNHSSMEKTGTNMTWWTYLVRQLKQRHSPVFHLSIKDIEGSMNIDQKSIFKGYGKFDKKLNLDHDLDISELATSNSGSVSSSKKEDGVMAVLTTLVDESRQNREMMGLLISALNPKLAESLPKPKIVKSRKIAKVAKKPKTPKFTFTEDEIPVISD